MRMSTLESAHMKTLEAIRGLEPHYDPYGRYVYLGDYEKREKRIRQMLAFFHGMAKKYDWSKFNPNAHTY